MNRVYWVDAQLDQIGHVAIDGYDRQTFTNIGQITQPFSLTIYSGGSPGRRLHFTITVLFEIYFIFQYLYMCIYSTICFIVVFFTNLFLNANEQWIHMSSRLPVRV